MSENPFVRIKARVVVLGFFAIAGSLALLFGILGTLNVLPLQPNDPILAPVLYILIFSGLCLSVLLWSRRPPLSLEYLLGRWPAHFSWQAMGLLVLGMFFFSLGAFQLSYLLLSLVAPGIVEATLQQTLLLSAEETSTPGLYNLLMLFSAIVVAPITEEFLFRGILLHRWGLKWGIRPAIVLTSIFFGVLHSNLIGLFVFGVIMSLLYLHTRSLLVPIAAHALNNAIATGLEFLTAQANPETSVNTLAEFRASWWLGVLCLAVSAPWLVRYIRRQWPQPQEELPYFMNQSEKELGH
ncbi:type II CAAX endopeptidase family protein [Pseudanabaena sp. FACHB-2040]|uniref:CPBP family intramembrane glutamic endopeptidase n=1 Tax=Pseudanabaena sp. FACHB-2040 TaxID=2692859 RepID=UPI0016891341|nr:type II CAAX endopeptidase family protein [Pseudanabaena sp. FACHB-2040]